MNSAAVYIGGADRDCAGTAVFKLANMLLDEITMFSSPVSHADIRQAIAITSAMLEAAAEEGTEKTMVFPAENIS